MALWAGTTINTNELSAVFNQVHNRTFYDLVKAKKGLLNVILGKREANDTPMEVSFERLNKITGRKIETRLLGKYKVISTLADGSAEVASSVGSYVSDYFGGAEFALTHYNDQHYIPRSELDRFAGDEAKTLSYVQDHYRLLQESYLDTLAVAVSGAGDQSRTTLGGWEYAINNNTYGTIDRTDSANILFRGHEKSSLGAFTIDKLQIELTTVWENGGTPTFAIAAGAVHNRVMSKIRAVQTVIINPGDFDSFGAPWMSAIGMALSLDKNVTADVMGLIDPTTWAWYQNEENWAKDIMIDPSKKSTYVVMSDSWVGLICRMPKHNAHLSGISS